MEYLFSIIFCLVRTTHQNLSLIQTDNKMTQIAYLNTFIILITGFTSMNDMHDLETNV